MAGAGKKTFTAGETLTASDVNTYLMEQSVMYFAGTAARSSAIPTPSTGMTTYIGVTGTATIPQLETYTGSAWQTPYGLTLLSKVDFSASSGVAINNVFTSNYHSYKIILSNLSCTASSQTIVLRLRVGGVNSTTNYYYSGYASYTPGSSLAWAGAANDPYMGVATANQTHRTGAIIELQNPQLAVATSIQGMQSYWDGSNIYGIVRSGNHIAATSYDGFEISPFGSTMTGTVAVYGFRNS